MDDTHLIVIGDNRLSFLTYSPKGITGRADVVLDATVRSLIFSKSYLYVISGKQETLATAYDASGNVRNAFNISSDYTDLIVNDDRLILVNNEHLEFYNLSGKLRYSGDLVTAPYSVVALSDRTLILCLGSEIERITIR